MIPEQWVSEIVNRYPFFSNKSEEEQDALRSDLISFASNQNSDLLQDILNEFRATEFKRSPGMWWFYQRSKTEENNDPSWRECDNPNCKKLYENKGCRCPICGNSGFKLHIGDSIPSEAIQIQEGCSECKWYEESVTHDVIGLYGPLCNEYGMQERGLQEICKKCKCLDCCNLHYLINHNPEKYRQRYGDLVDNGFRKVFLGLADAAERKKV